MKFLQIPICIFLIPALIASAPDQQLSRAAKGLLEKPRQGFAEITWRDGTSEQSQILRVTDSYVSVSIANQTCRNVELPQIANVKWSEGVGDEYGDNFLPFLMLLAFPPALLVWLPIHAAKESIRSHDSKFGSWETTDQSRDHAVELVDLSYVHGVEMDGLIVDRIAFIRTGRYRFEEGTLYTRYDDGDGETSVKARMECTNLLFGVPASVLLTAQHIAGPARAPIVGRWSDNGATTWEFHSDGTFRTERSERQSSAVYKKTKGGINVAWNSPANGKEEWQTRTHNAFLLITRDGKVTEFKRRSSF